MTIAVLHLSGHLRNISTPSWSEYTHQIYAGYFGNLTKRGSMLLKHFDFQVPKIRTLTISAGIKPAITRQPIDVEICSNPKDANGLVEIDKNRKQCVWTFLWGRHNRVTSRVLCM